LPISTYSKWLIYMFYGLFLIVVVAHHYYANWEIYGERRALSSLSFMGWLLVGKALTSRILSSELFASADLEKWSFTGILITENASSDAIFGFLGACLSISVPYFIQRGKNQRTQAIVESQFEAFPPFLRRPENPDFSTYDPDLPPLIDVWVGR